MNVLPPLTRFTTLSGASYELGEGVRIIDGRLHWVDLLKGHWYAEHPDGEPRRRFEIHRPLGVVEQDPAGRLIAAAGTGVISAEEPDQMLADTGLDPARYRVNDGRIAPDGSFWFSTMAHDGTADDGTLWRWTRTSGLDRLVGGLAVPNGPVFLADGTAALVADSPRGVIHRMDIDSPDRLALFAEVEGGSPDGMHIDAEGRIWSAVWGGHRVDVYAPSGEVLHRYELPVAQPTSVVTTSDGRVAVTSATYGLTSTGPLDGHVIVTQGPTPP